MNTDVVSKLYPVEVISKEAGENFLSKVFADRKECWEREVEGKVKTFISIDSLTDIGISDEFISDDDMRDYDLAKDGDYNFTEFMKRLQEIVVFKAIYVNFSNTGLDEVNCCIMIIGKEDIYGKDLDTLIDHVYQISDIEED